MVCKEQGHNSLLHCSKLPEYIPRGNNVKPIPRVLCKFCLSTDRDFKDCMHKYPKNYSDWICQQSKANFILCKECQKHQAPQDWLKENFKPHIGLGNLYDAWKEFNYDNAIINQGFFFFLFSQFSHNLLGSSNRQIGFLISNIFKNFS